MKQACLFFLIILSIALHVKAQAKKPEDFGYRHLQTFFQQDTVDILIKSKKGEENRIKPLFLFIQGSLPKPLIILDEHDGSYGIFPDDIFLDKYHVAIISKPYVPLLKKASELRRDMAYNDPKTGKFLVEYIKRDNLEYYTNRNKAAIKYLKKQNWISGKEMVIAGHSEGAAVAARLAEISKDVTHLIFASTNPFGRMMNITSQIRQYDDSLGTTVEKNFQFWREVVNDPDNNEVKGEVTYKSISGFAEPPIDSIWELKIPVMVAYGTKDIAAPFFDYMQLKAIRDKKNNITFEAYVGKEHNFFGFGKDGKINYDDSGWDKVAIDWKMRLDKK